MTHPADSLTLAQRQAYRAHARARLTRILRDNAYSVKVLAKLHAAEWDLYIEGAPYLGPGEIVCRGVGSFVAVEAEQRAAGLASHADFARLDIPRPEVAEVHVWRTPPDGIYTGHATLHALADGRWYYIESGLRDGDQYHRGISKAVPLGPHGELTPVPLTESGEVDVAWMRGIRLGARNITEYIGQATDWQMSRWRQEMIHQLDLIGDQLEDGSAFRLVGQGPGKRRSLA